MKINGEKIKAIPEEDVDRTSAEGKASSVQFIHFKFTDEQIAKFKNLIRRLKLVLIIPSIPIQLNYQCNSKIFNSRF